MTSRDTACLVTSVDFQQGSHFNGCQCKGNDSLGWLIAACNYRDC